ncbi:hypothetical protein ACO0LG_08560 [Undibacterium sp. Ji42W]|uniref:hypothetical protein n=1 Tax=Undibacterium sp. Ji42W TaxID=3413039 RepID=UPI003BF3D024
MTSQNTKDIAVQRAVSLLNASGAKYKIIFEGQEYGELVAVELNKHKQVRTNKFAYLYKERMAEMQPGDVVQFEHDKPEALRSTISARAAQLWGPGAHISTCKDGKVELLRVS